MLRRGGLAAALAAIGCSTSEPVVGEDDDVFFPSFRATANVIPPPERTLLDLAGRRRDPARRPGVWPTLAADLDFTYAEAFTSQRLDPGENLEFEDRTFLGPARVAAVSHFYLWSLGMRGGMSIADYVTIEGMGGAGFAYVAMELKEGTASDRDDTFVGGPMVGGQLSGHPLPWLVIFLRGTFTGTFGGEIETGSIASGEAGLEVIAVPGVGLQGGWRWLEYETERSGQADEEIDLSGPFVTLRIGI